MPRPFAGTLGLLEVVLLLSMTASAQRTPEEPKSPVSNESERHVSNYGDQDSTCIRWTDKCRTCNRSISADIVCSNIGIACQPAEVECLERQQRKIRSDTCVGFSGVVRGKKRCGQLAHCREVFFILAPAPMG